MQLIFFVTLLVIGIVEKLSFPYFLSISAISLLLIYQFFLIKNSRPEFCLKAFKSNNLVGGIIFFGILSSYGI